MEKATKIKTEKLRKPFYDLSDALFSFNEVENSDPGLKELVEKMTELKMEIYNHLEQNYI
jgi:hypothetical protein